jgi:hypothetical protein
MATYKHLRSSTANKRPTTSITDGQLAINTNTASPGLFFKDSAGAGIVKVGPVHVGTTAPNATPAAGGSSGNYTGEQMVLPVKLLVQTDAAGTGVEWTSNVDVPGTLDVTGATTLDSTLTVPLGSAASPTLRFSGDANSGLYSPGADQVAVATNGTGRLFVDASGNVGVGLTPASYAGYSVIGHGSTTGATLEQRVSGILVGSLTTDSQVTLKASTAIPIVFSTNNTERLRITSAGLVGIGTSTPGGLLHVGSSGGGIVIDSTLYSELSPPTATDDAFIFKSTNDGTLNFSSRPASGGRAYRFWRGSNVSMIIDDAGNVGIGTTSPANALLHVSSPVSAGAIKSEDTNSTGSFVRILGDAGSGNLVNWKTGTVLRFAISDDNYGSFSEKARIDSSGRLLVGTSSSSGDPLFVVHGRVGSATEPGTMALSRGGTIIADYNLGQLDFTDGSNNVGARILGTAETGWGGSGDAPGRLTFSTTADGASSPTERMMINSSGSLIIGGGSEDRGAWLCVEGSGAVKYISVFSDTRAGADGAHAIMIFRRDGADVYGSYYSFRSSTVYNTSSDYRLKENVTPASDGITRLQQLKPSRFNFIADPDTVVDGFLAHEVQAIVPEAITGEKDAVDDEGNPVYQGIDQSKLVPLLTAALQEAIGEIESLKARLTAAALEAN